MRSLLGVSIRDAPLLNCITIQMSSGNHYPQKMIFFIILQKKNRLTTIDNCKPMYIYYCIILELIAYCE